jgi:hypothetical protein
MHVFCLYFLFQTIDNLIKIPICGQQVSSLRIQNISRKYISKTEAWTTFGWNLYKFSSKDKFKIENVKKYIFIQGYGQNLYKCFLEFSI